MDPSSLLGTLAYDLDNLSGIALEGGGKWSTVVDDVPGMPSSLRSLLAARDYGRSGRCRMVRRTDRVLGQGSQIANALDLDSLRIIW